MPIRERIIVIEDLDERELPIREPARELARVDFAGTGPGRGEWEEAQASGARVEYIPPRAA